MSNLDKFVQQYLETALWADLPEENLHDGLTIENIHETSIATARRDCDQFLTENSKIISRAIEQTSLTHVAYHFWLTRNHHGAGFWDGDYSEQLGERLTNAAQKFNELSIYVGDDGLIYIG